MPEIAVCQSSLYRQSRRLRGQARSHILPCICQATFRGNGWERLGLGSCASRQDRHHSNVGAGLPAIAVCQSPLYRQGRRLRGQARSHILPCVHQVEIRDTCWGRLGLGSCASRQDHHHSNVGAGLPAIAVCQSPLYRRGRRLRGQARSHILLCVHQVKIRGTCWGDWA